MPSLLDDMPTIYRSLLPALGALDVPVERKATCANCALCPAGSANAVETVDGEPRFFRPDAKCCTYHPRMPNYLVGALLADPHAELAARANAGCARIASHHGVTPQWMRPPGLHQLMYDNARRAFGRSLTPLCPFFAVDQGNCTIWPYREAVCSTYFCPPGWMVPKACLPSACPVLHCYWDRRLSRSLPQAQPKSAPTWRPCQVSRFRSPWRNRRQQPP